MGEAWIPVIYAFLGAVSAGFAAWVAAKYGVRNVVEKADKAIQQNEVIIKKGEEIQSDMNGKHTELIAARVSQALAEERERVKEAIRAEIEIGIQEGLKKMLEEKK